MVNIVAGELERFLDQENTLDAAIAGISRIKDKGKTDRGERARIPIAISRNTTEQSNAGIGEVDSQGNTAVILK